jgi:methionine-rich copper-binding protein CopC
MSVSATHFAVAKSSPAKDEKLTASPKRIQIWFSQAPAAGVSQLKLQGADKAEIPLDKTVVDKDKSLYADVPKPLAAGAYTIVWRAAGDDGHVLNGEIKFTVAPK